MYGIIENYAQLKVDLTDNGFRFQSETNTEVLANLIEIPKSHPTLAPLLTVIPLQLLAYHIALLRGCNVDQPRNLAKSVTVE